MKTKHSIFDNQTPSFNCPFCDTNTIHFYSDDTVEDRLHIEECDHFILLSNDLSGIDLDPFDYEKKIGTATSVEHYSNYFSDEYTCCVLNCNDKENNIRYNNYIIYKEDS